VYLGRGGVSDSDDGSWSLRGLGSYYSLDLWVRSLYSILPTSIYKLVGVRVSFCPKLPLLLRPW
jgi:hypothetical protein